MGMVHAGYDGLEVLVEHIENGVCRPPQKEEGGDEHEGQNILPLY